MRILFVYPNVTRQRSPQLGICMVSAVARDLGHTCDLFDLTIIPEGEEISAFRAKLENSNPDVLAVSCRSNEWLFVEQLFRSVDTLGTTKIFGGPHATVAPEEVISIADIVVRGEGEATFAELLRRLKDGTSITDTAGTWVRQAGTIFKNEMRDLVPVLDDLPYPYWQIFDRMHYYDSGTKSLFKGAQVVGTFESTRGCPYACSYCTNDYVKRLYKGKGKWRRQKSPERIILEMRLFRNEYGLDCVYFVDEVMLTDIDRLLTFQKMYSAEVGVPFVFMERPENMIDEKVRLIKEAGAQRVSIGIESGDEGIRRNLLNRHHSQETIISAFRTARKHGLTTYAFTMIGFPGENKDTMKATLRLLRAAQPDTVQTTIFYPLRCTTLYDTVVNKGLFDPNLPMPRNYYDGSSLRFPDEWKGAILRWQFILTNYRGTTGALLALFLRNQFVFRILVLFRQAYAMVKEEGVWSVLKRAKRKIKARVFLEFAGKSRQVFVAKGDS